MTALPTSAQFLAAMDATWSAAEVVELGPFSLRRSSGGGKRVTAASLTGDHSGIASHLGNAEAQMRAWGQTPIFQITPDTPCLDALLDTQGYQIVDPVVLYVVPTKSLAARSLDRMGGLCHWPPLAIQADIWSDGGIGPDRLAVMDRVAVPKTSILSRCADAPGAAAFAAMSNKMAMVHAIEVRPTARRQGAAAQMLIAAARWSLTQGATHLAVAVTEANTPARNLYTKLEMVLAGRYHYRVGP